MPVDDGWLVAGPDGVDQVEIVMVAHPGAPELPIAKGASGGELSRVMLALEVVLADADPVSTMVFDEVDAGVGGRAATEIGGRLAGAGPHPPGHRGDPPGAGGGLRRPALRRRRSIRPAGSARRTCGWSPGATGRPSWPGCWAGPNGADGPGARPGSAGRRGRRRRGRAGVRSMPGGAAS